MSPTFEAAAAAACARRSRHRLRQRHRRPLARPRRRRHRRQRPELDSQTQQPATTPSSPPPSASSPPPPPSCAPAPARSSPTSTPAPSTSHPPPSPNSSAAPPPPTRKAILPVHLFGQCADWDAFTALTQSHPGLLLIEDAAQAFGAAWNGNTRRLPRPRRRLQLLPHQKPLRLRRRRPRHHLQPRHRGPRPLPRATTA